MSALQPTTAAPAGVRSTDRGPGRQVLLARRPGWRGSATLSDGVIVDEGRLRLADVAPRSVFDCPPAQAVALPDCQRGLLDAAGSRVLIVTGTGQVRRIIGPLPGWQPIGLVFLPPDRLAILDARHLVHLVACHQADWRDPHVETVTDVPGCPWPEGARRYVSTGSHVTVALDSGLPGCRWHAVRLAGVLAPGTAVDAQTLTTDLDLTEAQVALQADQWTPAATFGDPTLGEWDALVRGIPGQYLWLRLVLRGDGTETPLLDAASVSWSRHTSIERLPAVFAAGSDHLERLLAITDSLRDGVVDRFAGFAAELDPRSADADPTRDFLSWLGTWVGMDGLAALPVERRRRLVEAAADLYRRRGTPDGVARHVGLWLGRRTVVLEHFRLRRWAVADQARLGDDSELFGDAIVRRLRLGEFSQIGQFALVSVPSPQIDPFRVYAHHFTLFVHACPGDDLDKLASDAARVAAGVAPAHCAAHVSVVTATARLGLQARLGMDAVISGPPAPGRVGEALALAVAPDPARSGLAAVGFDAHVGSTLG